MLSEHLDVVQVGEAQLAANQSGVVRRLLARVGNERATEED